MLGPANLDIQLAKHHFHYPTPGKMLSEMSLISSSHTSPNAPGHHSTRTSTSTPATSLSLSSHHPYQQQQPHDYEIDYLRESLKVTQDALHRMYIELEDSRAQIARDTELVFHLNGKVAELEGLVKKQKMTISNQSKTISDPKLSRRQQQQQQQQQGSGGVGVGLVPMSTASQQGKGQVQGQEQTLQPSPTFEGAYSVTTQYSAGMFEHPPTPVFDISTSNAVIPSFTSQGQSQQHQVASQTPPPPPLTYNQPLGLSPIWDPVAWSNGSPYAAAYLDPATCITEFASRLRELWAKTELFGQVHANTPNVYKDSHLDRRVKEYIMAVSDRNGASSLLGSPATRFFLAAKAVNAFLVREVLKVTIIRGFDVQADAEIGGIKKQLFPDTPTPVRHLMVMAMVTKIQTLKTKPGFTDFCQQKTRDHMLKLWRLIGPLTNTDPTNQAWSDLSSIISEAEMLALDMYSVPFEYKCDFPALHEPFSPETMLNCDAFVTGDPQVLASSDSRVRLGVTPFVRVRDNAEDVPVVKVVSLGHVLLRQAQRH